MRSVAPAGLATIGSMTQELTGKRWRELRRETAFKGYSRSVDRVDFAMPDGTEAEFFIADIGNGACCLALTEDNKVIVAKQYRPGPGRVIYELPGGGYKTGQDVRQAAQRELLEETGYAGDVSDEWVGSWLVDAYSKGNRSVIIVKNCRKVASQELDSTEFIDVELLDMADFVAYARTGQLTDAAGALLALDHLGLL